MFVTRLLEFYSELQHFCTFTILYLILVSIFRSTEKIAKSDHFWPANLCESCYEKLYLNSVEWNDLIGAHAEGLNPSISVPVSTTRII